MASRFDPAIYAKLNPAQQAEYKTITAALDSKKSTHQQNTRYNQLINIGKYGATDPGPPGLTPGSETVHPNPIGPPTITDPTIAKAIPTNSDVKSVPGLVNDQLSVNNINAAENNAVNNDNQNNAFGSRTYTTDPTTGRQIQTDTLSGANQQALTGGQNLNQQGVGAATNILSGFNDGVNSDPRKTIQNAIYGNLTQGLETQYGQQKQDLMQQLVNSGNAPDSPAYQRAINNFENNFQTQRTQAQNTAIQGAGQEMSGELGAANSASNLGIGYQNPQYNAFNAFNQTAPDVAATAYQQGNLANTSQSNQNTLTIGQGANAAAMVQAQAAMKTAGMNKDLIDHISSILMKGGASGGASQGGPATGG